MGVFRFCAEPRAHPSSFEAWDSTSAHRLGFFAASEAGPSYREAKGGNVTATMFSRHSAITADEPKRAKTRGEAALHSPKPIKAWLGGASGGLVCVERTLLSAASDSCPEKRE